MANEIKNFDSPVGNLNWIFITGEGKENLSGKMVYTANVTMPEEKALPLIEEIKAFFQDNAPKGTKKDKKTEEFIAKSYGFKYDKDDEDNETGMVTFGFWTGTTWTSKTGVTSPTKINIFNAKGNEIQLGDKKIGNESRGRIGGAMGVYSLPTKEAGVTLYLNRIQLTKFVEFTGGGTFDEVEDDEGENFESADDGMSGISDSTDEPKATPRL